MRYLPPFQPSDNKRGFESCLEGVGGDGAGWRGRGKLMGGARGGGRGAERWRGVGGQCVVCATQNSYCTLYTRMHTLTSPHPPSLSLSLPLSRSHTHTPTSLTPTTTRSSQSFKRSRLCAGQLTYMRKTPNILLLPLSLPPYAPRSSSALPFIGRKAKDGSDTSREGNRRVRVIEGRRGLLI